MAAGEDVSPETICGCPQSQVSAGQAEHLRHLTATGESRRHSLTACSKYFSDFSCKLDSLFAGTEHHNTTIGAQLFSRGMEQMNSVSSSHNLFCTGKHGQCDSKS